MNTKSENQAKRNGFLHNLIHIGPLAIAGAVANAAQVVVTVYISHHMSNGDYGFLNQLNGLYLVVSTPGAAVTVAVVRKIASERQQAADWINLIHRKGRLILALYSAFSILVAVPLAHFLHERTPWGLIFILPAAGIWVFLCVDRGVLQAEQKYFGLSKNFLVEAFVRSVVVVGLVGMGFGAPGAALGILVAESVTAIHARRLSRRAMSKSMTEDVIPEKVGKDFVAAVIALASIALLQNIDVIEVAKYHHSRSGAYAAVSVATKALVIITLVLAGYLVPEATIRWRKNQHALHQFFTTVFLLSVPAFFLVLIGALFPRGFLSLFFPDSELSASTAFLPLTVAMVALSINVLCTLYLLAIGRRSVSFVVAIGAIASVFVIAVAHGDPVPTARWDLVAQCGLALIVVGIFTQVHWKRVGSHGAEFGTPGNS